MNPQETIRFENFVRSCGFSTTKEGNRYCQGVVNQLKQTWLAAQASPPEVPRSVMQERRHFTRRKLSTNDPLPN